MAKSNTYERHQEALPNLRTLKLFCGVGAVVLLISFPTLVFSGELRKVNPGWKVSCGVVDKEAYQKISNKEFRFHIDVGDRGRCSTDKRKFKDHFFEFTHSERQEVRGNLLSPGKYKWTASISIARGGCKLFQEGIKKYRATIFQVHDDRMSGKPPSWFGLMLDKGGKISFRTMERHRGITQAKNYFKLRAELDYSTKNQRMTVDYFVDEIFVATTSEPIKKKPYIKFGIYRVNGNCSETCTYKSVSLETYRSNTSQVAPLNVPMEK